MVERTASEEHPSVITDQMTVYEFGDLVSERLTQWAVVNTIVGLFLSVARSNAVKGFASQMVGWGVIDGLIAQYGHKSSLKRRAEPDGYDPVTLQQQTKNMRLALWINAGLDVIYVFTGLAIANRSKSQQSKGIGWGIVVQGGFLFLFDLIHAVLLERSVDTKG